MSTEENKIIFRRIFEELLAQGNLTLADELIEQDFVNHEASPIAGGGPELLRRAATVLHAAFPDLNVTIGPLIAEGDIVAGLMTMHGTQEGEFLGIPPTGRKVERSQISFIRFDNGKAIEHWGVRDDANMMVQLGVIPPPGQSEH